MLDYLESNLELVNKMYLKTYKAKEKNIYIIENSIVFILFFIKSIFNYIV